MSMDVAMPESLTPDCAEMSDGAAENDLKERVAASNLDAETWLATDYLNHFNEIAMLLEMIPDMPEIMEDVSAWQPKSYTQHFQDSTIADKDIAVDAYAHVDDRYKVPFEQTVAQLNTFVADATVRLTGYIEQGETDMLREQVRITAEMFNRLLETASGIIHGSTRTMDQSEIDQILG